MLGLGHLQTITGAAADGALCWPRPDVRWRPRPRSPVPILTVDTAASDVDEANEAVVQARGILQAVEKLLPNLGFFA